MKKTKRRLKINRFEKILYIFTLLLLIATPVISIYAKSTLSQANYEVESKKDEISEQSKSNESLQMKINELASLENIEEVAKNLGLSYTSDSVKTVE